MQADLERVRDWAKDKLHGGSEPPWAWYQYMKLVETTEAILDGMAATSPTASLQQSAPRREMCLRLVDSTDQNKPQSHRARRRPPQMPM